jgi:hypothetical protein
MELTLVNADQTPDHWLHVHKVATGASLTAGALAYAVTNVSGRAATGALANTVRIGGSLASYTGWYLGGDIVGLSLQAGTNVAVSAIETAGESATMVGSLLLSTAAALTVGTTVMIGNTIYMIYKNSRISQPLLLPLHPTTVVESEEDEFVVYLLEDQPVDMKALTSGTATTQAPIDVAAVDCL